jgi:hypothetical protein
VAAEALQRIGAVYQIEELVRGLTAAERGIVRQSETKPILEAFKIWLMQRLAAESAKSDLAKAIKCRRRCNHPRRRFHRGRGERAQGPGQRQSAGCGEKHCAEPPRS